MQLNVSVANLDEKAMATQDSQQDYLECLLDASALIVANYGVPFGRLEFTGPYQEKIVIELIPS